MGNRLSPSSSRAQMDLVDLSSPFVCVGEGKERRVIDIVDKRWPGLFVNDSLPPLSFFLEGRRRRKGEGGFSHFSYSSLRYGKPRCLWDGDLKSDPTLKRPIWDEKKNPWIRKRVTRAHPRGKRWLVSPAASSSLSFPPSSIPLQEMTSVLGEKKGARIMGHNPLREGKLYTVVYTILVVQWNFIYYSKSRLQKMFKISRRDF